MLRRLGFLLYFGICGSVLGAEDAALVKRSKSLMDQLFVLVEMSKKDSGRSSSESSVRVRDVSAQIDFERIASQSLGSHWKKIPPSQRKEFKETLQQLLEVVVYPKASRLVVNKEAIQYEWTGKQPQNVKLKTSLEREKRGEKILQDLEVELVFSKGKPDAAKVVDAIFEGEQISKNLRRQFDEALKKKSFVQILDQMKKRLLESKKALSGLKAETAQQENHL